MEEEEKRDLSVFPSGALASATDLGKCLGLGGSAQVMAPD
jgi:hypothetical protein